MIRVRARDRHPASPTTRTARDPRRLGGVLLLALVVSAALAACGSSSASGAPASDVQKQADLYAINQIEVKWHQAPSTKNLDLMMSLWADNATFTTAAQTYSGKDQIRQFFTGAAPFKPENNWVSDTPAYKSRTTLDGDKGTLYFQCDYIDVDTKQVKIIVSADQEVARINGKWLITSAVSATPSLGG